MAKKVSVKSGVLTVGSKHFPCRITMGAMRRFKQTVGYDVNKLKNDNLDDLITFVWCCVASACAADGVEFGMDVDQFADTLTPDDLNSFYSAVDSNTTLDSEKKI